MQLVGVDAELTAYSDRGQLPGGDEPVSGCLADAQVRCRLLNG